MYCSYCGAKIMDGSTYCTKCGADLSKPHDSLERPAPEPVPIATPFAAQTTPIKKNKPPIQKVKKPVTKKWWFWVIVIFVGLCVIGALGEEGDSSKSSIDSTPSVKATASTAPTPSPTPTLSPEEQKANFVASCQTLTYEQVARDPDTYTGTAAHFKGKVSQVIEDSEYNVYMINVTPDQYGLYTDAIYVQFTAPAGATRILEDDIVDVYGTMAGLETYTTVLNAKKTIPAMLASYIDLAQ